MSNELIKIVELSLFPSLANLIGGVLAEIFPFSKQGFNLAMHVAVGSLLALIGMQIMPEALKTGHVLIILISFMAGGVAFMGIDKMLNVDEDNWSVSLIMLGISIDLAGDGLIIGSSANIDLHLAFFLSIAQILSNFPSGFSTTFTLRHAGIPRGKRLVFVIAMSSLIMLTAIASYLFLRQSPGIFKFAILTFTAGILLAISIEEMIRQAHQQQESHWETICLLGGFSLFVLAAALFR